MELKADQVKNWDVIHINTDHYGEFPSYLKKFDIRGMAEQRVLAIPDGMIDPKSRNIVALGNIVDVVGYNRQLISVIGCPIRWKIFSNLNLRAENFLPIFVLLRTRP